MYINRATILGNVGKDPEVRTFNSGGRVMSFSVATSEQWKDKNTGETQKRTQWHNVQVFNESTIKFLEGRLTKGSRVHLEGTIETRKWQAQSGEDRYVTEICIRPYGGNVILLDGQPAGEPQSRPATKPKPAASDRPFDDDIPF